MNSPTTGIVDNFHDFVSSMPELLQPIGVALLGAIPFVEGMVASAIGIVGGINPVVAAVAGALGNFLCVAVIVLATARVRTAATSRRQARAPQQSSKRNEKFQRAYHRYGTVGVSLLGPIVLPTQFTSAALTATGVPPRTVLLWQAVAIALWTLLFTLGAVGIISFTR